jgi:hypothetical protein
MPLPDNFSPWEHFQNVVRKIHNKQVREFFKADLLDDDITSSEGAVRFACLMDDNDTAPQTIARMLFFAFHCGWSESLFENIFYGVPKADLHQNYYFVPQIRLIFQESKSDMRQAKRTSPKRLRITFRWIDNPIAENVTQNDVNFLISRINSAFPISHSHYCGLDNYIYYNVKKYDKRFCIPARNETDAKKFLEKIHHVMNIMYDPSVIRKAERNLRHTKETIYLLGDK